MIIRPAELKDKDGAGIVRAMVLSQNHPYQYEQNIGLADTLNLVAEKDGIVVGFVSVLLRKPERRTRISLRCGKRLTQTSRS
jgi:hypothetical protein